MSAPQEYTIDDLVDNMQGALKFFLAHLNGLLPSQWDWKPYPACRSIREMLSHLCETYESKAELEEVLALAVPNIKQVQDLLEAAAMQDYERLRTQYNKTTLDLESVISGSDFFLNRSQVKIGTLLARRAWEECYHTGQVVFIRLATDPEWDQEADVYGLVTRPAAGAPPLPLTDAQNE